MQMSTPNSIKEMKFVTTTVKDIIYVSEAISVDFCTQ